MTRLLLPLFLIALVHFGCTDPNATERRLLLSELQEAESRYALASQQILERRSAVQQSEARLKGLRAELIDYEGNVQAFMMNNKMAVAALAAGTGGAVVALDATNEFSEEARQVGGVVGVLGGLYCMSNFEECTRVGDQLVQASAHVESLKARINSTEAYYDRESQLLATAEQEFQTLGPEVRNIRSKLRALNK